MNSLRRNVLLLAVLIALAIPAQPVFADSNQQEGEALLARAQQLMDLRAPGNPAFHLTAQFQIFDQVLGNLEGTYQEVWMSPDQWRREINAGSYHQVEIRNGNKHWILHPLSLESTRIDAARPRLALTSMELQHLKIKKVHDEKHDGVATRCISVEEKNYADEIFCLDAASGLLLSEYNGPEKTLSASYSDFATFGGHSYARKVREFDNGKPSRELTISELAEQPAPDLSLFAATEGLREVPGCQQPARPQPVSTPDPPLTSRKSSFEAMLWVIIGTDGTIIDARVARTSGDAQFDSVALDTVRRWRFKPATCSGQPIPVGINIDINTHIL